jgi:hypothetical protein
VRWRRFALVAAATLLALLAVVLIFGRSTTQGPWEGDIEKEQRVFPLSLTR